LCHLEGPVSEHRAEVVIDDHKILLEYCPESILAPGIKTQPDFYMADCKVSLTLFFTGNRGITLKKLLRH